MSVDLLHGPRLTVEAALGNNPQDASVSWVDVSEGLRSGRSKRGRSHELDRMQAGVCSLTWRNDDDRWNRWNTMSPFYGNLLTANQSSFETDLTGWAAALNCAVSRVTTQALNGAASMRMTATAGGNMQAATPSGASGVAVIGGSTVTGMASFLAHPGDGGRQVRVRIDWSTSGGVFISSSTGNPVNDADGTWTQASVTAPAPATAAFATLVVEVLAAAITEQHYVDQAGIFGGTVAVWSVGGRGGNIQPMVKMRLSAQWNLLTAQQASLEALGTAGWSALQGGTIARSTAMALEGTASLEITSDGTEADARAGTSTGLSGITVTGGKTYSFHAAVHANTMDAGRTVQLYPVWWDISGNFISYGTPDSVSDSPSLWAPLDTNSTAPTNALYASLELRFVGAINTEKHYIDQVGIFPAPNITDWSAGGPRYLFTGYGESVEHSWPSATYAETTITVVDGFKVLALARAARTDFYDLVTGDGDVEGYWRLNEPGTASVVNGLITAVDSSGNTRNGTFKGSSWAFGQPGSLPTEIGGAVDLGVRQGYVEVPQAAIASGTGDFTVELWVYLRSFSQGTPVDKLWHLSDVGSQHVEINIQTTGKPRLWVTDGTNGGFLDSAVALSLFRWHHIVAVKSGTTGPANWRLYIDGVDESDATSLEGTGNVSVGTNAVILGGRTVSGTGATTGALDGLLDEVAMYSSALSSTDVTDHYAASFGLSTTALSGARIGKLLDVAGHPIAERSLDAGQFLMQAVKDQLFDHSPLPLILDYVDSEGPPAAFFFAGNGDATFHDRAHATPPSSGTFGDGVSEVNPHSGAGGHPPVLDDADLWPTVVGQALDGAPQRAHDADAAERYVDRTLPRTNLRNASDADVATLVTALAARYDEPVERVRRLVLRPAGAPGPLWSHVLGREITDRITYNRHTFPGGGDDLSLDVRIEGIEHDFGPERWETVWQLAPT